MLFAGKFPNAYASTRTGGRAWGEFLLGGSMLTMESKEMDRMGMEGPGLERYCAVDPGVTTGFVMVDLPGNWREMNLYNILSLYATGGNDFACCRQMEIHGPESGQIDEMMAIISGRKGRNLTASAVVIEDFILRLRTQDRALLAPVRVAARLEDRLYSTGFQGVIRYQSPSDAKSIVTDQRLKEWGLWHVGSPHIRDAWRHMVKFLRENRG